MSVLKYKDPETGEFKISRTVKVIGDGGDGAVSSVNGKVGKVQLNAEDVGARAAITPQMYGAKGDGVTDDTAAFKAALAAERVVFVPGGRYRLSGEIVIGDNCMLELSQDTVLEFANTTGNCINLGMLSNLKGNHATIKVPYAFEGNVLYAYSNDKTENDALVVPPWKKWDPQWKSGRYVTDVNICKADSRGFHYAVTTSDCKGAAVYLSADATVGLHSFMWGIHYSGLRIAGAFAYGIYGKNLDEGWTNDMRIDAYIDACEIGVCLEDCDNAYVSAIVQPRRAYSIDGVYSPYAKHGIKLVNSKNVDLSGSRVWDWQNEDKASTTANEKMTLWTNGGEYQHIAMIGECRGTIISDFYYHEASDIDIRKLIYTDYPSNLQQLTILQEPIDRWFKMKGGEPYCTDGTRLMRLLTEGALDPYFQTDVVKNFDDALASATDTDGVTVYNGIGYKEGVCFTSLGNGVATMPSVYYMTTGFIPVKPGSEIYCNALSFNDLKKTYAGIVYYNSKRERFSSMSISNVVNGNLYYVNDYKETANGCQFTIANSVTLESGDLAYIRLVFPMSGVGDNPMISVDAPIEYTIEGFLADSVKVKGENIIGTPGQTTPDWVATKKEVGGDTIVIPEQTVSGGMWNNRQQDLQPGIVYEVYINGVRYTCMAGAFGSSGVYLGNASLAGNSTYPNNNEPFCIVWWGGSATSGMFYYDSTLSEPLTLKVTDGIETIYDKMPDGYLPNSVVKSVNGKTPDADGNVEVETGNGSDGFYYVEGNSTTAGKWTGTCKDITEYYDGLTVLYKLDVAGTSATTLNINNLGAVDVKRNATTAVSTNYPVGSVVMLTYSGGVWLTADYDANTKNTAGTSKKDGTKMFLVGATSQTSSGTTTYTNSNVYIGDDNNLYSGGKKVANDEDVVKTINGAKPDESGNVNVQTGGGSGGTSIDVTAEVGQTIIVEETDADGKVTKWKPADYQPRTHWSEKLEVLPEITVEIDPDAGMGLIPYDFSVDGSKTYVIDFNGVEYTTTPFVAEETIIFGNGGAMIEGAPVTDDPFVLAYTVLEYDENDNPIYTWVVIPLDGSATVTVSVSEDVYHTIPYKYLEEYHYIYEIPKDVFKYWDGRYVAFVNEIPVALVEAMYLNKPVYLRVTEIKGGVPKVYVAPVQYGGAIDALYTGIDKTQKMHTITETDDIWDIRFSTHIADAAEAFTEFFIRFTIATLED